MFVPNVFSFATEGKCLRYGSIRMPPGSSGLADGALCSIATWIADGATY